MADFDPRPASSNRAGLFGLVAAVGVALLCVASVIRFFTDVGNMPGEDVTPALFGLLGVVALSLGLALASVLQRDLSGGVRAALLIGAGYFAIQAQGLGFLSSLAGFL